MTKMNKALQTLVESIGPALPKMDDNTLQNHAVVFRYVYDMVLAEQGKRRVKNDLNDKDYRPGNPYNN